MIKNFLDSIEVKSPCNESWDEMTGNDEVRFCSHCAKDIHNISAMNRAAAEKLVKKSNGKLCVRYVKTPEGNLITAPPKFTQITRRATIAASVLATSLALTTLTYAQGEPIARKDNSAQTQKEKTQKDETKQGFATISGMVKDVHGAIIPGAKITLRNVKTEAIRLTTNNYEGIYEFKDVETGVYEMTFEYLGFEKGVLKNIHIGKDAKFDKSIVLAVSSKTEIVGDLMIIDNPPITTTEAKPSKDIQQKQLLELPINGRTSTTMGLFPGFRTDEEPKQTKPKKKKN